MTLTKTAALATLLIAATSTAASSAGILISDPGNRAKAEKAAADYIAGILKDPESARFRFQFPPIAGSISGMSLHRSGYFLCGEVNARNSYGGYGGFKPFLVIFQDINLHSVAEGTVENPGSQVVNDWCGAIYR